MTISSHEIQSVLRTYGKQIRRGLRINQLKQGETEGQADKVRTPAEIRRRMVVDRVASEILLHMVDPSLKNGEVETRILKELSKEYGKPLDVFFDPEKGLILREADDEAGTAAAQVPEEAADELRRRLMEITTAVVDETML